MEFDSKTGEKVVKFRITRKVPGRLRVIASEALNHLRHSLDQAVNAAAFELGRPQRNNYFPFAKNAGQIDNVIGLRCKTVPPPPLSFPSSGLSSLMVERMTFFMR
jgi:hypothetical protein